MKSLVLACAFAVATVACGDDPTPPAPCALTCTTPPASQCVGAALRSYASPGVCGGTSPEFACTYGYVDIACENGCESGACLGVVDPCAEIVCNAPPAKRCVGAELETFASLGVCDAGACAYGSVKLPCSQGCEDGACLGDPCAGVVCNAPPSACHAATGVCSSGVCSYAVLVGAACDDGVACTERDVCGTTGTCAGRAIACQSPPAPVCAGDTLKVSANGACADGACEYSVSDVVCADGCAAGACLGDPCAGVVCDAPPTACHAASGTCTNGVCEYAFDNGASCDDAVACTDGDHCENGVCRGTTRACVTPPAAMCKDASTLVASASSGTCADGACGYVGIDVPCAFGCVTVDDVGRCEGDPCGGVTCATPPKPTCANTTSLVVPAPTGACSGGDCGYDTVVFTCANGCQAATAGAAAFCKAPTGLVISEFLVDSRGFPDTDAFVEIHGPANTKLDGVTIVAVNGNGGADYETIALTGTLDSAGLYIVAHPDAVAAIADMADLLDADVDFQNGPDSVQLRFGAVVLDAVAYGGFDVDDVMAGEGSPVAPAPVDQSLARDHAFTDTNDNAADFAPGVPTPGVPTPTPVVDVPPVAALSCPTGGVAGVALTFDAAATTGTIASYAFAFGDGTEGVSGAAAVVTHAFVAAGTFTVVVTATEANALTDTASCAVVITAPVVVETPVTYAGVERCFAGESYIEDTLSNPVAATTDGLLTVTFSGTSPYGPRPYEIELQTGANTWKVVATTNFSKVAEQTERFRIAQGDLNVAIQAMGWLRFRHSYQYNGGGDCMTLSLAYNCESCFACPVGEQDLGIGCQPVAEDYDYIALEHSVGKCGQSSFDQLYLPGTPAAAGDGIFSIDFLGCGNTSIALSIYTQNSGWVAVGSDSGSTCSFSSGDWVIPEAYLDAAVDSQNRIRFKWDLNDTCSPGTGCQAFNDPCVKNAHLIYPR